MAEPFKEIRADVFRDDRMFEVVLGLYLDIAVDARRRVKADIVNDAIAIACLKFDLDYV